MSGFDKVRRVSALLDLKRHQAWAAKHLKVDQVRPLTASQRVCAKLAVLTVFVLFMLIVSPH
jgi:hypothetical protein